MSSSYVSSTYEPKNGGEHPKRAGMVENNPARKRSVKERDINESAEEFIQKFRKQLLQTVGINCQ
ncbi:hypothetical protein F2Q70_00037214 [Brassica cretica]|uniref:BnaC01g35860D protein n=6 Tax=Brassica TaxID=3705 RepID=A0A078GA14_BRANA|nr:hypothetical protein F2Q70_00037214 [Brassica cretica]KAG2246392.1 hypothetical protein Bca52824_086020 [Brassica carinata]CDY21862.1 BnaC01g35860D [Brassica napus]VDD52436.1 unnamed protein product [Brassica oleracea]KAF3530561.1 hypothetical protein DY000_02042865 [Brassica cretica]